MKIVLETLGCKLNQAETEYLAARFAEDGHTIVRSISDADIYVLNTCTVTHTADAKARQALRKAHRKNPAAILAVTGCYAERKPDDLSEIDGISVITGNGDKLELIRILREQGFLNTPTVTAKSETGYFPVSRTRAFIRIQDGCRNFCTYCIVPFVRREETSVPADEVVRYVNVKITEGIREAVLTGTEVGTYRDGDTDLAALLHRLLNETSVERLRLSSLQPDEITADLLSVWKNTRMCPHFHLSLQSGSDRILKRMNRRYTTEEYLAAVKLIEKHVPDAAITTDIIAGFPGETEEDYQATVRTCRETGFARIHVFPYSKRPETAAAKMPDQVRDAVKTQRNQDLGTVAAKCAVVYQNRFTGRVMDVLWEQKSGGMWSGYTGNYIRVYTEAKGDLTNTITPAKLTGLFRDGRRGTISE